MFVIKYDRFVNDVEIVIGVNVCKLGGMIWGRINVKIFVIVEKEGLVFVYRMLFV